ncbi:glycosyltransferase family 87 protein [Mycobacterium paragordonae]|uniref:glycosyltransferase family 87 protein n=1 Tax=Mycobacterium paragordonae TaxID=1389713 RepID=UPI001E65C5E5|nr:glycosyltransferase family 87 protein [Mycobacterium paragordonae]
MAVVQPVSTFAGESERTLMLGTILLATAAAAVTGFVLTQYYAVDAMSSLVFVPDDCYLDWGIKVGRHCFSDYTMPVSFGLRPNPWEPYPVPTSTGMTYGYNNYAAAGMLPLMIFGVLGKLLGAPQLALLGYILVLTVAVLTPAVWAARGAVGVQRIVVFIACGVAAIPAWMVIDRGNSAGFVVPIALVFLVALCRQRWGLVAVMVILAALIKPQFALIGVVLFAARQCRWAGIAVVGGVVSNIAAYALWPRDFPQTIEQSIHNTLGYGSFQALVVNFNVSFGKALLMIPDGIKAQQAGGKMPDGFLAGPRSLIGYVILGVVVVALLVMGRRISPVMAGIVLLAAASLSPPLSQPYYLVFVLPIAALVARDPAGPPGTGIFDRAETVGGRRRAVGVWVSLAVALSIAHIAIPSPSVQVGDVTGHMGAETATRAVVVTTVSIAPILWLIACAAILISYARRPLPRGDEKQAQEATPETAFATSPTSESIPEFSPQGPT